jgi:hypothetical protein
MEKMRATLDVPSLEREYDAFSVANNAVEDISATWQLSARDPVAAQAAHDSLRALFVDVRSALERAAVIAPNLSGYVERLAGALDTVQDGDMRYLTSPLVESFNQVWAELHQDLLVTLGREPSS